VSSPQFQQALSLFSSAFQSAQLAPLIREFSLGDQAVAAATAGDMEAFVKALQKDKKGGAGGDKKHEPEDMALD
jgi:26S proteasome regulatory subunit N13